MVPEACTPKSALLSICVCSNCLAIWRSSTAPSAWKMVDSGFIDLLLSVRLYAPGLDHTHTRSHTHTADLIVSVIVIVIMLLWAFKLVYIQLCVKEADRLDMADCLFIDLLLLPLSDSTTIPRRFLPTSTTLTTKSGNGERGTGQRERETKWRKQNRQTWRKSGQINPEGKLLGNSYFICVSLWTVKPLLYFSDEMWSAAYITTQTGRGRDLEAAEIRLLSCSGWEVHHSYNSYKVRWHSYKETNSRLHPNVTLLLNVREASWRPIGSSEGLLTLWFTSVWAFAQIWANPPSDVSKLYSGSLWSRTCLFPWFETINSSVSD